MSYLLKMLPLLISLWLTACASHPLRAPLAMAKPLEALSWPSVAHDPPYSPKETRQAPPVLFLMQENGLTELQGPRVTGTRGDGLNVATSLYQLLDSMGLQTEVSCHAQALSSDPGHFFTQVKIFFRLGLSTQQKRDVAKVLSSAHFLSRR